MKTITFMEKETVSLITIEQPQLLGIIKLPVSKSLVDDFERELSIFNKNNKANKLNFNKFAHKLIAELQKINNKTNANTINQTTTLDMQNNRTSTSINIPNQT